MDRDGAWVDILGQRFAAPGFDPPGATRLQAYEFHYLRFLLAPGIRNAPWISSWIADYLGSPLPALANEPYVMARRILTLCLLRGAGLVAGDTGAVDKAISELARGLSRKVEFHLRANHLAADLCALAVACASPGEVGPRPDPEVVHALLREHAGPQVMEDGVHEERNTAYHLEVMRDLWIVACVALDPVIRSWADGLVRRMAPFARAQVVGGTTWRLWGDSGANNLPEAGAFLDWADQHGMPAAIGDFPHGGYSTVEGSGWRATLDQGPLGPDHQPGHAHGDWGHLDVDLDGRLVYTDTGNEGYEGAPHRNFCRSARAHNVLVVDETDQAEFWGTFRVGRRPAAPAATEPGVSCFEGYGRMPGRPVWARRVRVEAGTLRVIDRVEGSGRHRIRILWHSPWPLAEAGGCWRSAGTGAELAPPAGLEVALESCVRWPAFGTEEPCHRLSACATVELPWEGTWILRRICAAPPA